MLGFTVPPANMPPPLLSSGSVMCMHNMGLLELSSLNTWGPVRFQCTLTLQILDFIAIHPKPHTRMENMRYRLVLSDGHHIIQSMLSDDLRHLATDGSVSCTLCLLRAVSCSPFCAIHLLFVLFEGAQISNRSVAFMDTCRAFWEASHHHFQHGPS